MRRPLPHHARLRRRFFGPVGLVLIAALLLPAAPAIAAEPNDMVLQWNAKALVTIGSAPTATPPGLGQPPPLQMVQLAIVQGAVYDALNAIEPTTSRTSRVSRRRQRHRRRPPPRPPPITRSGMSPEGSHRAC